MTPREKAIKTARDNIKFKGLRAGGVNEVPVICPAEKLVDSIIAAAREGMVSESGDFLVMQENIEQLYQRSIKNSSKIISIRESMVGEDRVKELIHKHSHDPATHNEITELFVSALLQDMGNKIAAHRATDHLPNGTPRRHGGAPEPGPQFYIGDDGAMRELHTAGGETPPEHFDADAAPAPWTPKVGELAWSDDDEAGYFGICTIESAGEEWTQIKCQSGSLTNVRTSKLRPLRASDWIVKVEGFGKVEAWYSERGDIEIESTKYKAFFRKAHLLELDAGRKWCETHNVPIKPWKEGE